MENRRVENQRNNAKKPRLIIITLRRIIILRDLIKEGHNKDWDKRIIIENLIINWQCRWNRFSDVDSNTFCIRYKKYLRKNRIKNRFNYLFR